MGCHRCKFLVLRHQCMCKCWSVPIGHQLTHGVLLILGDELLLPTCYANIWGNIAELIILAVFRGSTQKVEVKKKKELFFYHVCDTYSSFFCQRPRSRRLPLFLRKIWLWIPVISAHREKITSTHWLMNDFLVPANNKHTLMWGLV